MLPGRREGQREVLIVNNCRRYQRICILVAILTALTAFCGCQSRLISRSQEIQLGQDAGDDFEHKYGRDRDPNRNALVKSIGANLERAAEPPDYPYDYRILASNQPNAVAFPGGRIYIFRGMIKALEDDQDKIAWVLGHETTHVAHQHAVHRIERQLGYEAIIALIFKKKSAARIAGTVGSLMLLDYGRDNEFEADREGMLYAHNAGYDPTAAVAVLELFQEIQSREPNDFEIMFATHPGNKDRINHARGYLEKMGWSGAYYTP